MKGRPGPVPLHPSAPPACPRPVTENLDAADRQHRVMAPIAPTAARRAPRSQPRAVTGSGKSQQRASAT